MKKEEFRALLEAELNKKLEESEKLHFSEVRKNNGLILTGISVYTGINKLTPTVYIEEFFRRYQEGMPIGEITEEILKVCRGENSVVGFDIDAFTDFEKSKERIAFRLINTAKNEELLKEVPGIPFLDLTMVFYYLLGRQKNCRASILIRNEHLDVWDTDTAGLYAAAKENLPRLLPFEVVDMKSMMTEILQAQFGDAPDTDEKIRDILSVCDEQPEQNKPAMYVLTNKEKYYGAAGIACAEVIGDAAETIGSDLYILPSSVHEVILLPASSDIDPGKLSDMVKDVNRTQLSPEEVLSDSVYRYSKEKHEFKIVCA